MDFRLVDHFSWFPERSSWTGITVFVLNVTDMHEHVVKGRRIEVAHK